MENLTSLKQRIIDYLSGLSHFENAAIVAAFPEKQREYPLKSTVIAVEAAGVEIIPAGLGGYLGGDTPLYGASALIALRFGIYAPSAESCGIFYESLCNALFDSQQFGIIKINGERCEYNVKTAAYLLLSTAVLKAAWIVPKQDERLCTGIYLKDVNN